jgi:glycosyltransferase involved in cell wall biosynthesis
MKKYFYTLKKPDLIILSVPPVDSAASFVNFAKKNKIPLISDFRDMWPDIINHNLNLILKIFFYPFYLFMYFNLLKIRNNSDYIISVSKGMLKWIKNKSNKIVPSSVIYLFHNIPKIKKKKINNIIYFYYAGVISTSNHMQKFLEYFDNLPTKLKKKIKINISGYGDAYNYLSSNLNIKNVKFLGWINQKEITRFSNKSHYGLVTYKNRFDFKKNIPNKISEYLGYGMPVLTTLKGESFDIMKFYSTCIYINLENQKSFENSIQKIIRNNNYYKMSQNSRNLFLKKFDGNKNLKNYYKIIKRFI